MPTIYASTQSADSNVGSPTSMNCSNSRHSLLSTSCQRQGIYGLSHIMQYLTRIEDILQSTSATPSPAIRYHHCYQNNQTFFKSIGSTLAKPMLRTLIYGDINDNIDRNGKSKKVHFDQRIREARVGLEGQKMYSFVMNSLRPAAEALDSTVRDEMVPEILSQIQWIESTIETSSMMPTGTRTLYNRLASGRRYQGKLESMICDLFPQLLEEYRDASRKASDREVLEFVVSNDLNKLNGGDGMTEKRIRAISKCLDIFYPAEDEQSLSNPKKQDNSVEGIESGKRCEESCLTFLHNEYTSSGQKSNEHLRMRQQHKILQNVYVNVRRNGHKPGQKYVPPKTFRKGSTPKQKLDGSGIIWTDALENDGVARHRLCSEFDAVVISSCNVSDGENEQCKDRTGTFVDSIFEAKKTISPSTLHDIFEKKLGAIEALVEDKGAQLVYKDGDNTETIPFSDGRTFTFGIYGSELLEPENAADSIRSIAGSNVVSSDINEVIRALERDNVMVEVELSSALSIVQRLKSVVEKIQNQNQIEVAIILEEGFSFL